MEKSIIENLNSVMSDVSEIKNHLLSDPRFHERAINLAEAAKFCGISSPSFRMKVISGEIPSHRPKGLRNYKFFKSELTAWLKGQKEKATSN